MESVEVKVSAAGNEQYAAWREGTHDDLVFAVALACWALRKRYPRRRGNGWWQNGYQDEARKLLLF